jgi:hypothetical protein
MDPGLRRQLLYAGVATGRAAVLVAELDQPRSRRHAGGAQDLNSAVHRRSALRFGAARGADPFRKPIETTRERSQVSNKRQILHRILVLIVLGVVMQLIMIV